MTKFQAIKPHRIGTPIALPTEKRKRRIRSRGQRKVRDYRIAHGCCELCEQQGIYRWALEVHHLDQLADIARRAGSLATLALEAHQDDKLLSVCKSHHKAIHRGEIDIELIEKAKGIKHE